MSQDKAAGGFPQGIVYMRKRGMHYNVVNPVVHKNDYGPPTIKQGIEIFFKPNGTHDQRAEFDPMKHAKIYVQNEITSGNLDPTKPKAIEKKENEIYQLLCGFIERHVDYNKDGHGMITRKPTKEQVAVQIQNQINALEQRKAELQGKIDNPETIDPEADDTTPKEVNPLVKGGGVSQGASMRTAKRG